MEIRLILSIILVGIGATIVMDLWALLLKKAFAIPSLNYCFVGRWLEHMPSGRFTHQNIAKADPKPLECHVGWTAHYLIGIGFAAILVFLVTPSWLQQPTVLPALLFGILTVALPFLLMQPSLGLGVAASKTSNPMQARLRSVMVHASFGLGLYLSAAMVAPLLHPQA